MFEQVRRGRIPYFAFPELDALAGLVHALTFRATDRAAGAGQKRPLGRTRFPGELGIPEDRLLLLEQVHSARVIECGPSDPAGCQAGPADGWLLNRPGYFGAIRTADCLPVLAVAGDQRQACALHAGWRGTRDRIVVHGIRRLIESSGADPGEITVALGPAIRACCYEVGEEVRAEFAQKAHPVERIFRGRHLDLIESNRIQLAELGVTRILDSGMCTVCHPELFYSYRRDRDERRMWAILGFRESGR